MYSDVFMFSHVLSNPESRLSLYTYQFKCDSLRSAGLQVRGSRTTCLNPFTAMVSHENDR